ncbi:electron transfer flavoprotein subunit beta/FixA family protein [Aeoliella mucimassa]|uniref:Electron transfer flavoprotein subunit beta n=1 Tax=Aeoliella mucimassa TaxID=2527972 RepID=A0A518AQQ9_9BACT|nr:electron transfer flavoprotein subunit beta/FixA family protein [Aeoliella mucimassa]QDU57046.1 Electron transfer flavoprotein subunit beta [Aeoliella mucimassa]
MRVVVPIKRVPDTDQRIEVSADGASLLTDDVPWMMNPFDAIALEQAITLAEEQTDVEVVAVSIGPAECEEQLRSALAMGADRAVWMECSTSLDPWGVASLLKQFVASEQPDLVLMGKQAVDDDANQTGQMLAAMLDWPQATFVSKLEINAGHFRASRETDTGLQVVAGTLPAVVTADLRLNEPRYASLAGIMKAKKKPIEHRPGDELLAGYQPRVRVVSHRSEANDRQCAMLNSVEELADVLRAVTKA